MNITYLTVEGTVKPLEIDVDSSPNGVYIRRNIKEVQKENQTAEDKTETITMYEYQEAFLTKSEYEQYSKTLLVGEINGERNTKEFEAYKAKLATPIEYTNGKFYKPEWIDVYSPIIDQFANKIAIYGLAGGDTSVILDLKTEIYDVTGKAENAELLSVKEIIDLWLFLYAKKEQYFKEYKESLLQLAV